MVQSLLLWFLAFYVLVSQSKSTKLYIFRDSYKGLVLKDSFDNPTMQSNFCSSRNAVCFLEAKTNCTECTCSDVKDTFVSYNDGCETFDNSLRTLESKINLVIFFM